MTAVHPSTPVRAARGLSRIPWAIRLAIGWLLLIAFVTVFARVLQPYSFEHQSLLDRLKPPVPLEGSDWAHPFGTDRLGRDLFSRVLVATQTSVALALLGTVIGAAIGITLGFVAAHFGRWIDEAIMALVDFQAAMPWFIIALAILAFMGNALWVFLLVMALYGWETYARITRGLVLTAREEGYARAVRGLGAGPRWIYARHILPNIAGPLLVQITINFPSTILFETSLSFLGLGVRPPLASLGQLLAFGRDYLLLQWWLAMIPGAVIFLTVLSMSVLGDWLRTRLDPSLEA